MRASTTTIVEARQRRFYSLDESTVERLVREVLAGELSIVDGGALDRFEARAAELFGGSAAVATCNGTAALHLALLALELGPGDEVLLPTYAYYGMALPICLVGAKPVFCDIRADDLTLDPRDVAARVTPRTRAILAHQPWGCPADVEALRAIAERHGLALLSDSSHAQGALWRGASHGAGYDVVCASLGKSKLVSGGELGVVVANDDRLVDRMLLFGHVNRVPDALRTDEYRHFQNAVGVKYRPHAFALALALAQLDTYAERSRRLVANVRRFEEGLGAVDGFSAFRSPRAAERVYWRVPVRLDTGRLGSVESVVARLRALGCPTPVEAPPPLVHRHNTLTEFHGVRTEGAFPVAEKVARESVLFHAIPFFEAEVGERVLELLREPSA